MDRVRAVGFRLNLDTITSIVQAESKAQETFRASRSRGIDSSANFRRCEVVVTSFDPDILRTTGIQVLQDLWTNDFRAELSADFASIEQLEKAYRSDSIGWIVIVRYDGNAVGERSARVRNVLRREDADVTLADLVIHLRNEIRGGNTEQGPAC